jgi:hypothetical protein
MKVLLETYYILLPIIATALIGWVGVLLKGQKKKDDERERRQKAQSEGIMLILRYMLQRYHGEYHIQGVITYNQYKNWSDIYQIYKDLGGNSVAEEWNDDIERMEKRDSASEMSIYAAFLKNQPKE